MINTAGGLIIIFISRDSLIYNKLAAKSPRFAHHLFPTALTDEDRQLFCKHAARDRIVEGLEVIIGKPVIRGGSLDSGAHSIRALVFAPGICAAMPLL